jgi:hypothetical protein
VASNRSASEKVCSRKKALLTAAKVVVGKFGVNADELEHVTREE